MTNRKCRLDRSGTYRYVLIERWNEHLLRRVVVWICLNPSRASQTFTDPTLRKIIAFSQAWGFTELRIVNLFAYRSPSPAVMWAVRDPIGPKNNRWLRRMVNGADLVIAGWGADDRFQKRATQVLKILGPNVKLRCLRKTKYGYPGHPLWIRLDTHRTPQTLPEFQAMA